MVTLPYTDNMKVPDTQTLVGLVSSDEFAMQQKMDGRRLIVMRSEHGTAGYNKSYEVIDLPSWLYDVMGQLPGAPWMFDGELCDGHYYVFDLVDAPGDRVAGRSFDQRSIMAGSLISSLDSARVHHLTCWFSPRDKLAAMLKLKMQGAEGVVFRPRQASPFFEGTLYKYKFYNSVDAIVLNRFVGGKEAIEIGLLRDNEYVSVGKVKVAHDLQKKMATNQVVEVRYRKLGSSNRLVEPVFLRARDDKPAYKCTWDQLEASATDETIIDDTMGRVVSALGISHEEAMTLINASM